MSGHGCGRRGPDHEEASNSVVLETKRAERLFPRLAWKSLFRFMEGRQDEVVATFDLSMKKVGRKRRAMESRPNPSSSGDEQTEGRNTDRY